MKGRSVHSSTAPHPRETTRAAAADGHSLSGLRLLFGDRNRSGADDVQSQRARAVAYVDFGFSFAATSMRSAFIVSPSALELRHRRKVSSLSQAPPLPVPATAPPRFLATPLTVPISCL